MAARLTARLTAAQRTQEPPTKSSASPNEGPVLGRVLADIDADVAIHGAKHDARGAIVELGSQGVEVIAASRSIPFALVDIGPNGAVHRLGIEETARVRPDSPSDGSILIQDGRRLPQGGTRGRAHIPVAALNVHAILKVDDFHMSILRAHDHNADSFDANVDIDGLEPWLEMIGL